MTSNLLVFIHGITPEERPQAHTAQYEQFWTTMLQKQPSLRSAINSRTFVEWGSRLTGVPDRPDSRLSVAEQRAGQLVHYDAVKSHPGPNNVLQSGIGGDWNLIPGLRLIVRGLREQLIQYGIADAIYYSAEDGERAVRNAVYSQVLAQLRAFKQQPDVRLHVIAHSLGVTVAHDFLYGLFGKDTAPDFLAQAATLEDKADYQHWRERAAQGALRIASFVSMASQLPIFVLRKQALVDRLAAGGTLDTSAIGIRANDEVRWLITYDVDDVLGFATRELYGNPSAIRQLQVDAGDTPLDAHLGYWQNAQVTSAAAELIARNAR